MIDELLLKRAIEPLPSGSRAFFNRVFLVPKRTGGFRLILDVSKLNEFLRVKKFSMDTVQKIRAAIEGEMWGVSVDLSDAYHHIPIAEGDRRFLAFEVGGRQFCYCVCPFGLSPIPQVFTEALMPLKLYARKTLGLPVFQYLDDWLILSFDQRQAADACMRFVKLSMRLGLLVNLEKSQLFPSQRMEHLGVDWDFKKAVVRPPVSRVDFLRSQIEPMVSSGRGPLLLMESVRGQMVSMEKLIRHARINFRSFQRVVTVALKSGRSNRWLKLSQPAVRNLKWWLNRTTLLEGVPAIPPKPNVCLTTDASRSGWGAHGPQEHAQGKWSPQESTLHINALELLAVQKSLELWGNLWFGQAVRFLLDNRTAVAYVCKQGGTRSSCLNLIAESIFLLADGFHLTLSAAYLPGEMNAMADMLSRKGQVLKHEWSLGLETFRWVCSKSPFGLPTIDLFANAMNHRLPKYFSPCPDPEALSVDALSTSWPQEVLYAFPPSTILDRFLLKAQQEKPKALILIAPLYTTASWYPSLRSHAMWVLRFPKEILSLHQPHWDFVHASPELLSLGVWYMTW